MQRRRLLTAAFALLPALGCAATITFEGLPDSVFVTSQYPGLTFTNSQILSSGISLNELEFPPHSGSNVIKDYSGPISIVFANPQTMISGYFTYLSPLTLNAYSASSNLIGSVSSSYTNNTALSGDAGSAPNELLQIASSLGISKLVITGDPVGGSFVMDDLTFAAVPEPSNLGIVVVGIFGFAALRVRGRMV